MFTSAKLPNSGGDAVDDGAAIDGVIDHAPRSEDGVPGFRPEDDRATSSCHVLEARKVELRSIDRKRIVLGLRIHAEGERQYSTPLTLPPPQGHG